MPQYGNQQMPQQGNANFGGGAMGAPQATGAQAPPSNNVLSMLPPDIRAKVAALPPDQQAAFLQKLSQDYAGKRGVANDQIAMAEQLRSGAPRAQGRQAGNVYAAANPLEHIAKGYQQRKATDMQRQAIEDKKKLAEMYGEGTQEVMASMLR